MNTIVTEADQIVVRNSRGLSIADTRITLYDILDYLKQDWSPQWIQTWFDLSDHQIQAVMDYIEQHREEVEAEYQEVLREAEENRQYWEERNRELLARVASMPPPAGKEAIWAKLQARKSRPE
jgi:uncharacterized protein (DUF433 family)